MDVLTLGLFGGVLVLLGIASTVVRFLKRRGDLGLDPAIVETFRLRVWAWWLLFTPLAGALLAGEMLTFVFFLMLSFWALREFITLTPTRPADHRALFWVFFICTPLQYVFLMLAGRTWFEQPLGITAYDIYSIFIPVYAFLLIPARIAFSGDSKRFLERTAKIQAGLLICVYCLSYAPALLTLKLPVAETRTIQPADGEDETVAVSPAYESESVANMMQMETFAEVARAEIKMPYENAGPKYRLLFFFVLIVQLADACQYLWSQIPSRHAIVPSISPARTWEGLLGSAASVTLIGAALSGVTPFHHWWQAAFASFVVSLTAFGGGLTMSAIKRDRGVKDYGTLIEGHGGVLDRIDSLCFSAPVFFHLTYFFVNWG
jgi:phosphatidate cytidylyltransferase